MAIKLHIAAGPAGLFRCSFHCLIVLFVMVLVTATIYLSKESKTVLENSFWTPIIHAISSFSKTSNISANPMKSNDRNGEISLTPMNVHGNSLKSDDQNGEISLAPMNHIGSALSMSNNSENSLKFKSTGRNNSGNSLKPDDQNGGISLTPMNHIGSALSMPNNSENSLKSKSTGRNNSGNSLKPDDQNGGISLTPLNHIGSALSMPNNSKNSLKPKNTGRNNSGNSLKPKSTGRNNSGNSLKPDDQNGGISLTPMNHIGSALSMSNNSGNSLKPKSTGKNNSGNSLTPMNYNENPLSMLNNSGNSLKPKSTGRNNSENSLKPDDQNGGISLTPMNHIGSALSMSNNSGNSLKPKSTGRNNSGNSLTPMNYNENPLSMLNNSGNSLKPKSTGRNNSLKQCDFSSGKWVYDNKSYPLYKDYQCPYMADDLACKKFGRKDLKYQNWRWQPKNCDIPKFNAKALLERLKDKRLVFVGDSVNKNQWVSMMCLIESTIPGGLKSNELNGSLYTFKAAEYNASIDFYWAPLLVESNADDPSNHRLDNLIVKTDAIEKHARHWIDADILVFNSFLWWRSIPVFKVLSGSFESPKKVDNKVKARHWYKMVLGTWSDWLDTHVNRTKTKLFFVSMTATHHKAEEWGMKRDHNCMNEREPIMKEGYRGSRSDPKMMRIVEEVIRRMKTKGVEIQLVNVAQLTEYRKDGHPSIYKKQWWPLSKEQLSNPMSYADCTHWCLPGVPDVWNEILSAYIVNL